MRHLGDWAFTVYATGDAVFTDWSVYDADSEVLYEGRTEGSLPWAVLDAYDKTGLTCPLVIDPDLQKMAGMDPVREEDA
jgi:hypothetical protein